MMKEIKQAIIIVTIQVLGTVAGCVAFGAERPREFDRVPKPALERFPATRYVAPPTPKERAERAAEEGSNRVARARCREAVRALALSIGAPTGTTYEATVERARVFEELAKRKK